MLVPVIVPVTLWILRLVRLFLSHSRIVIDVFVVPSILLVLHTSVLSSSVWVTVESSVRLIVWPPVSSIVTLDIVDSRSVVSIMAVSYTHLDVYKRQGVDSTV